MENQGQLYFGLFLTSDTLLMTIILLSGFLALAVIISMMRIYKKCGKPSISVIVPIWGQIVLFQITKIAWWYIFIPIVNFVMMIKAYIILAKKFGKGAGFAVGMIFLPMIFIPLLSFYDCVDEEEKKVQDEPIYNPFNQTNVEQIMPEAPITTNTTISQVEPTTPVVLGESDVNNVIAPAPSIEPIITENVIANETVTFNESEKNISDNDSEENVINNVVSESVIPETVNGISENVVAINNVEKTEENPISDVNTQTVEENIIIPEVPIISNTETQVSDTNDSLINNQVGDNLNPSVQDLEVALNINKEPSQVAFNSTPIQEEVKENVEVIENLNVGSDDAIELPEIAAKVCPACGVSLAEDINFCTSCGTKL